MIPSHTVSRMKWKCRSICFVLAWNWLSFDRMMVDWLSQLSVIGEDSGHMISPRNKHNHRASFAAWVVAMYSASVVDRAMINCFLELQLTMPTLTREA